MKKELKGRNSRRKFIKKNLIATSGLLLGPRLSMNSINAMTMPGKNSVPSVLDGVPVVGSQNKISPKWPKWPVWIPETDEPQVLEVLRSGVWSRSKVVDEFEERFAKVIGTKRCLTTVNGTNALICALKNLN